MTADTRKAEDIRRLVSTIPHGVKGLDPRTKLVIIIVTSALCLMARGEAIVLAIAAAAFALAAAGGSGRAAAMALAAYAIMNLLLALAAAYRLPLLSTILLVIGFTPVKFIPVFLLVSWFVQSTRTGELICALERSHLPKEATIPLAVALRYAPTIGREASHIRDALRMRGLEVTGAGALKRPLAALEHLMVPLLMRCLKVADELSLSAISRGIESSRERTCVRDVRLRGRDAVALAVLVAFTALVAVGNTTPLGEIVVWQVIM